MVNKLVTRVVEGAAGRFQMECQFLLGWIDYFKEIYIFFIINNFFFRQGFLSQHDFLLQHEVNFDQFFLTTGTLAHDLSTYVFTTRAIQMIDPIIQYYS